MPVRWTETRLIEGNCAIVMAGLPDESIDLILTSPPYDDLRSYHDGGYFNFPTIAAHCRRLLKPGGVLVWVVGDETADGSESGASFRQALHFKAIGLNLHDTMIYEKENPMPGDSARPRYVGAFEFMFVLSKGTPKTWNPLVDPCKLAGKINTGTYYEQAGVTRPKNGSGRPYRDVKVRSNIWRYPVGSGQSGHPAVFPLQLALDHISSWTDPGDLVLDPMVGSGTTLEACARTGRSGIGIERVPAYASICRERLAAAQVHLAG